VASQGIPPKSVTTEAESLSVGESNGTISDELLHESTTSNTEVLSRSVKLNLGPTSTQSEVETTVSSLAKFSHNVMTTMCLLLEIVI